MRELIDGLNTRFNITIQSSTDREFYQNLYHYFDHINNVPELHSILHKSQHEYADKHSAIWEKRPMTEEEGDEAERQTHKLERFNLYALGASPFVRIFLPIDDYRKTNEPDIKQDPVAVILMKGIDYAISLKKWSKKNLQIYNRWFDGKRNEYEVGLRRFHLMFLDELEKIKEPVETKPENNFYLNVDTGDFEYHKVSGVLSPKSREFIFLKTLYLAPNHQSSYKELIDNPEIAPKTAKIALTETVKIVKRKLGILPKKKGSNLDIIKNISKYGYKLDI